MWTVYRNPSGQVAGALTVTPHGTVCALVGSSAWNDFLKWNAEQKTPLDLSDQVASDLVGAHPLPPPTNEESKKRDYRLFELATKPGKLDPDELEELLRKVALKLV